MLKNNYLSEIQIFLYILAFYFLPNMTTQFTPRLPFIQLLTTCPTLFHAFSTPSLLIIPHEHNILHYLLNSIILPQPQVPLQWLSLFSALYSTMNAVCAHCSLFLTSHSVI